MKISALKELVQSGGLDEKLIELYGEEALASQKERYLKVLTKGQELFGDEDACLFSAPGRTEVGGNHTDHQLGRVLAASLNLDVIAVVSLRSDKVVRYASEGFTVEPVDLSDLSIREKEINTTEALIRGTAAGLEKLGYRSGGFDCYAESDVIPGGGMSSSAAFEVLLGTIMSELFNDGKVSAETIAKNGQYAENVYFGKPCGLLDQMACSVGSFAAIDFADKENPVVEKIDFNPADYGYKLILTDVRASHAELSGEYGAVPAEMKCVAKVLGYEVLSETNEAELTANVGKIREACGDRAFLRAYHFVKETERAKLQAEALKNKDIDTFLNLIKESGHSSYMYLQNINVPGAIKDQPVALALALSDSVLAGKGAYRVHGGGFAGTIQAFVPEADTEKYIGTMENAFGKGCCYVLRVRNCGGIRII